MKRKIFLTLTLFGLTIQLLFSQIPVGYKFDLNGQPIEGYVDPLIYNPAKRLTYIHNPEGYEKGYYYDNSGSKIKGYIKLKNKKIWFRQKEQGAKITLKPDEVRNFVIGADSFFVTTNLRYNDIDIEKSAYMQHIASFGINSFAIYYRIPSDWGGSNVAIEKYIMYKSDNKDRWESISPKRYAFTETFGSYFNDYFTDYFYGELYPLKDHKKKLPADAFVTLIKTAQYQYNYKNGKPIYYDQYWQETRHEGKSKYQALITSRSDSSWTVVYFSDSTIYCEIEYSCFYPHKKNGVARSFYANGKLRMEKTFENDSPIKVKTYNPEGLVMRSYRYDSIISAFKGESILKITYDIVLDSMGVNLIDTSDEFEIAVIDTISDRVYTQKFVNKELVQSYTVINGQKVYQITDPNYVIKIKSIQSSVNTYMKEQSYDRALMDNAQGQILVTLLIDSKGRVIDFTTHNKLHSQLFVMVKNFYNVRLGPNAEYRNIFKRYKVDGKKVAYEVLVTFDFGINRFYRKPAGYYHHDMFWHQQFMMQNQFQPVIPNFNTGF